MFQRSISAPLVGLLAAVAVTLAGAGTAQAAITSKYLSVPIYKQSLSNHCWATSAQMILKYTKNVSKTQCEIATATMGGNCPNVGATKDQMTKALKAVGLTSTAAPGIVSGATGRAELTANRPWIYFYLYQGQNYGHYVVVTGFYYEKTASVDSQLFYWNDPATGTNKGDTYQKLTSNTTWKAYYSFYGIS